VTNLHFNYKDVFRAGRLGFSAKKIWVTFVGFLIAFIGYSILAYLSFIAGGIEISEIWETFRVVPMYPAGLPWYSWVIWIVGLLWWLCVTLLSGVAVSKITYEQLKGDDFYEIKEAVKFALKNGKSAILAPFVLIISIIILIALGLILGLFTLIPYVGQLILAVMAIPAFAASMFIIYLAIVTLVCLNIGPAIVGETANDTFDTLFESFSVINDQPWRFILYEILLKAIVIAGVFILGFFAAKAIFLGQDILGIFVSADKLDNLLTNAAYYVKVTLPAIYPDSIQNFFIDYLDSIGMLNLLFPPDYIPAFETWAGAISSFILGLTYYLIVLFVMSYGGAIFWSGNTLIFTVLVKKKDDKNLLEMKEEAIEEPAVEQTKEEPEEKDKEEKKTKRARKKKEKSTEE